MKKINFLVVALAVLALVGCKEKEVIVNSITLDQTEVTIKVGGDVKLNVTIDPANAANIEWKSSDTKVATVAGGLVKGVGGGHANITATAGGKTAICKVTVVASAEVPFNIEDFGFFGSEIDYIPDTETDIELRDGSTVHCQLGYIWCYGWDGDLQCSDVGWIGAGEFILGGQMPVYWIIEGEYEGYYIGRSYYTIGMEENDDDIIPYNMAKAHVDKDTYGDWVSYVHGDSVAPDLSGDGAQDYIWEKNPGNAIVTYWDYENDFNYADYGLYEGYFNKMIFRNPDKESKIEAAFYADINWVLNDDNHTFGFTSTYNAADSTISFVRPYEFTYVNTIYDDDNVLAEYEEYMNPKEEEAQYFICSPKTIYKELPVIRGNKATDKLYKVR